MTKSDKDKEEGDNDASSETQEAKSASGEDEHWTEIAQRLQLGFARTRQLISDLAKDQWRDDTSGDTDEESSTMSEEQVGFVRELCRQEVPLTEICKIMGVERHEKRRMHEIAVIMMGQPVDTQEGSQHGQAHPEAEEVDFEPYDPVLWETAAEETTVHESPNEEGAVAPNATEDVQEESSKSLKPAPTVSTSEPEFVRALKDSGDSRRPYFKKGDILRVINKTSRRNLGGQHFELLPLKPPGQPGPALIKDFEPADQADADAVGEMAFNEKEKDSFRCAMEWED